MNFRTTVSCALLGFGVATSAMARPTSPATAIHLLTGADVVVIGRVISVDDRIRPSNIITDETVFDQTLSISVDSLVKGDPSTAADKMIVRVHSYRPARQGAYAIFFLSRTSSGVLTNASIDRWTLPALQAFPARHAPAEPRTHLTAEMAAILLTPEAELQNPVTGVTSVDGPSLPYKIDSIYAASADALQDVPADQIDSQLHLPAGPANTRNRLWIADCLLAHGVFGALVEAAPAMMAPTHVTRGVVRVIAAEIGFAEFPPSLTPTLLGLLRSTEPEIRANAAEALGRNNDAEALAPIVQAIRSEPDVDALHEEADGLCRLVHNTSTDCTQVTYSGWPVQSPDFWRSWAHDQLRGTTNPRHD